MQPFLPLLSTPVQYGPSHGLSLTVEASEKISIHRKQPEACLRNTPYSSLIRTELRELEDYRCAYLVFTEVLLQQLSNIDQKSLLAALTSPLLLQEWNSCLQDAEDAVAVVVPRSNAVSTFFSTRFSDHVAETLGKLVASHCASKAHTVFMCWSPGPLAQSRLLQNQLVFTSSQSSGYVQRKGPFRFTLVCFGFGSSSQYFPEDSLDSESSDDVVMEEQLHDRDHTATLVLGLRDWCLTHKVEVVLCAGNLAPTFSQLAKNGISVIGGVDREELQAACNCCRLEPSTMMGDGSLDSSALSIGHGTALFHQSVDSQQLRTTLVLSEDKHTTTCIDLRAPDASMFNDYSQALRQGISITNSESMLVAGGGAFGVALSKQLSTAATSYVGDERLVLSAASSAAFATATNLCCRPQRDVLQALHSEPPCGVLVDCESGVVKAASHATLISLRVVDCGDTWRDAFAAGIRTATRLTNLDIS